MSLLIALVFFSAEGFFRSYFIGRNGSGYGRTGTGLQGAASRTRKRRPQGIIKPVSNINQALGNAFRSYSWHLPRFSISGDRKRPEETMTPMQKLSPAIQRRSASHNEREPLVLCPLTMHPCEGDLAYLCEDYGCARKGGLSPQSKENL